MEKAVYFVYRQTDRELWGRLSNPAGDGPVFAVIKATSCITFGAL